MSEALRESEQMFLMRIEYDVHYVITDDDRARFPGLHFCPDWDYMAVYDDTPEVEGCGCKWPPSKKPLISVAVPPDAPRPQPRSIDQTQQPADTEQGAPHSTPVDRE